MASYAVNERAVARARTLEIEGRQYVLDSDWGDVQPRAEAENAFLESHSWAEYAGAQLGLTEGAATDRDQGPPRLRLRRLPPRAPFRPDRLPLHRAAEWRHKEIELAAHELLQLLDEEEWRGFLGLRLGAGLQAASEPIEKLGPMSGSTGRSAA